MKLPKEEIYLPTKTPSPALNPSGRRLD